MFYKIQFTPRFLKMDGGSNAFDFKDSYSDLPFTHLVEEVFETINEKLRVKPLNFKQTLNYCDKTNADLTPQSDYNVRLYFYSNPSIARHHDMEEVDWSFHAVKSGIFQPLDKHSYSKQHRIFVKINKDDLLNELRYFRKNEKNPGESSLDEYFLEKLIVGFFKEAIYALEYIENGNGLSPSEVADGDIDPYDISLGIGTDFDVDMILKNADEDEVESLKKDELYDIMEERVAEKARELFRECNSIYQSENWENTLKWFDREMAPMFNMRKNRLYNLFSLSFLYGSNSEEKKEETDDTNKAE